MSKKFSVQLEKIKLLIITVDNKDFNLDQVVFVFASRESFTHFKQTGR